MNIEAYITVCDGSRIRFRYTTKESKGIISVSTYYKVSRTVL